MRNWLYYSLKPFLPWRLRMAIRRIGARRTRNHAGAHWPILPSAAQPPPDWPGWPNAHEFAFVLSHDVEGPEGLARVRPLAEMELAAGFRSSFNFIPEGTYSVPDDLREWLVTRGFEVGVHDLNHDGRLYTSHAGFRRRAQRINHYLQQWQAVGFRSGFMHRNLGWLHDLNVLYDASTFDTDPFEPQPDGTGTIFPFWILAPDLPESSRASSGTLPGPRRPGYVELPYTLAQDSTLFLLLRESSPEVWISKLHWIARHAGMALVNVHPDYVRFPGDPPAPNTYPATHYQALLEAVARYPRERCWRPLPREVASWFADTVPPRAYRPSRNQRHLSASLPVGLQLRPPSSQPSETAAPSTEPPDLNPIDPAYPCLAGRHVAVLLYSYYPSDSRPRRAAEALAEAGAEVELLCLRESSREPRHETIAGVRVTRLPLRQRRGGVVTYAAQYLAFFLLVSSLLILRGFRKKFDLVHAHNMPDFLVFAAWLPKRLGTRIILDLHDPMPELFMTLHDVPAEHRFIRLLSWIERRAIAFSHLILTPNEAFRERFVSRSGAIGKVHIVMNLPEETIFHPDRIPPLPPRDPAVFRLMYHGSLVERHGLDVAIQALEIARKHLPEIHLDIFGAPTPYLDEILDLARQLRIQSHLTYHGMKPETEIAWHIARSDLGIIPNRYSPFIAINLPTRIFEYLAMGRPVVVPNTRGIRDYFGEKDVLFFKPDDPLDLARRITWVRQHPAETLEYVRRGRETYQQHLWRTERRRFLDLASNLLQPHTPTPSADASNPNHNGTHPS